MAQKLRMGEQEFSIAMMILFVLFINMNMLSVKGDYGGWESAHATFYGGGDASGTMGEFKFNCSSAVYCLFIFLKKYKIYCFNNYEKIRLLNLKFCAVAQITPALNRP